MNVNVASTRGRAGFHNTSADIATRFMLLLLVIPQFGLLHPLLHFTFVPAAAAAQLDGFREMAFTDQLVKPFICHTGETGDVVHVDQDRRHAATRSRGLSLRSTWSEYPL